MGGWIELKSLCDEHPIRVRRAPAVGPRKGGVVLIQEIFGVTADITALADEVAGRGYDVLAPSLYDRIEPGFQADHSTPEGLAKARAASLDTRWETVTGDVQACLDALRAAGPVFVMGFCYGGSATWVAACRCRGIAAASAFYGRLIVDFLDETPTCPIALHFGRSDPIIPMDNVARIAAAHPSVPVHVYEAGHGFASSRAHDFDAAAKALAFERTFALFDAND